MRDAKSTNNPEDIARRCRLPNDEFGPAWTAIKMPEEVKERLLAQSLLSFTIRQRLPFESAPLHGLILLTGAPGTGKTTLARGLANQVAKQLSGVKSTFVEVDPHALTSSALGRSQQAVAKLFEQTLPEIAMDGPALVLLDEVETLAVSRHQLSLDANPIDVHRATDAALSGMDRLTREHRNILLIATTNFPKALDSAILSRADHIEEIGLPNAAARQEIFCIRRFLWRFQRGWTLNIAFVFCKLALLILRFRCKATPEKGVQRTPVKEDVSSVPWSLP
jgi:SpoVK/Ycf46/Vps4 family AAA+-type ATPase